MSDEDEESDGEGGFLVVGDTGCVGGSEENVCLEVDAERLVLSTGFSPVTLGVGPRADVDQRAGKLATAL